MRNHICSLLIFLLLSFNSNLSAQQGWERIQAGIIEPLHDIEFINDSTGFIYSYGTGNIYRTDDVGLSWDLILHTDSIYYEQIQFVESRGWICGEYGKILKTTDSGISWEDVTIKSENNLLLYGMHFKNSLSGIVTGAEIIERKFSPRILITGDGGNTWVEEMADFPYMILNLTEKDNLLFASGTGYISTINIEKGSYKHIFRDTLKLIGQIRDIEFSDSKFGMGCSFNGYILTTNDGGETFSCKQITNNRLRSIAYIGGQHWIAAGDNNKDDGAVLYTSYDNGKSWQRNNDFPDIHRIHCTDKTIWIVGKDGLIAKKNIDRIPVLQLHSTSYKNGYLHGQNYRNSILVLHALWKENLEATYGYDADEVIMRFLDSTEYVSAIEKWTPHLLEEIRGISDGSGIDFNTTLAFQLVDEMWSSEHIIASPHHCSSLGFNNFILDGSENYIAQNIDITPFYHGFEILLDIHDTISGKRQLISTFAGYIGANGLNNEIGVCVNALIDLKSSVKGLPVCCVVRGILDQESFEDAENFIRNVKHASGQNYLIGSRKKIKSFECASDKITVFWPDSRKTYTYHTNQAYANDSFKDSYANSIREQFQADPGDIHPGCPRFEMIEEVIHNTDEYTLSTIKGILPVSPVFNRYTWLSTIMEFNDDKNILYITPGKEAPANYIMFEILN